MKIDKITIDKESINFETGTVEEIDNYPSNNYLEIILTGKKIPKVMREEFDNNNLIDVAWLTKKKVLNGLFMISSYSTAFPNGYELTLTSSGAINEQ